MVTAQDVADFLGQGDDTTVVALAGEHLPIVTEMVLAYTRGKGFNAGVPTDGVAAVIITSTARLVRNPTLARSVAVDDFSSNLGAFIGWTLPELAVLHRYRKRAQ